MPNKNKKVLIITYSFPPVGGGGTIRMQKFAKYLPFFNWSSLVLTTKPINERLDHAMMDEIKLDIEVIRTKGVIFNRVGSKFKTKLTNNTSSVKKTSYLFKFLKAIELFVERLIFLPDKEVVWNSSAYKEAVKKINEVDAILTTGPPHSTHLIGKKLKDKFNKPWIVDFRDGWTGWPYWEPLTFFHRMLDKKFEQNVVESADIVITATDSLTDYLKQQYKYKKVVTLTNGYDNEDFDYTNVSQSNDKFRIVYAGSLKRIKTGLEFYRALSQLIKDKRINSSKIEVLIFGPISNVEKLLVKKYNLIDVVLFNGFIPHKEVCSELIQADALLLVFGKSKFSNTILTGKIFDYIAARKPIIGVIPEGEAKKVIINNSLGVVASPEKQKDIEEAILEIYNKWENDKNINTNPGEELLKKYSRKQLTKNLSNLLNEIS